MNILNKQMLQWGAKLRDDLKIPSDASKQLATTISDEVSALSNVAKWRIITTSPVSVNDRLDELTAFQAWMDYAHTKKGNAPIIRAQLITQNYICFVYLGDAWFKALRKESAIGSVTKKCCKFLTDNPVRAFRNAVAHSNWCYNSDFSGLKYWARKDSRPDAPLLSYEVSQNELNFWQALARCTAYASFLSLK